MTASQLFAPKRRGRLSAAAANKMRPDTCANKPNWEGFLYATRMQQKAVAGNSAENGFGRKMQLQRKQNGNTTDRARFQVDQDDERAQWASRAARAKSNAANKC